VGSIERIRFEAIHAEIFTNHLLRPQSARNLNLLSNPIFSLLNTLNVKRSLLKQRQCLLKSNATVAENGRNRHITILVFDQQGKSQQQLSRNFFKTETDVADKFRSFKGDISSFSGEKLLFSPSLNY
jgi:hypothetical protein